MQPSIPENRPVTSARMLRRLPRVQLIQISHVRGLFQFLGLVLLLTSCGVSLAQLVQVNRISTIAGNGTAGYSGDGAKATGATLNLPDYVAVDSAGNIFIADYLNSTVRKIAASTGIITTVAGNGTPGFSGDGGAATSAQLGGPGALALDTAGNLYLSDPSNNRVRKVDASTGIITTVAGNGIAGSSGDGGAATNAELNNPIGIALGSAGDLFIAESNSVRKVSATTGIITTVISNGSTPSPGFNQPIGIAIDGSGNLFIADTGNNRVLKLTAASGTISIVAGNGTAGYSGDGGPATSAEFNYPGSVALDNAGNLYINDSLSNRVRKVSAATGIISTVAGDGTAGYAGDGGAAVDAEMNAPGGVALDSPGNLYISDSSNNVIREVSPLIFPSTAVAASSAPQNLLLQTTQAETITSFTVPASQGNKQEYAVGKVTGCATDGATSNPVGTVCTIPITFIPAYPGLRSVPLKVVTSAGNVNIGLNGTGVGPLAALTPGTISTLAGEVSPPNCNAYNGPALLGPICNPVAGAVDAAGNVYIAAFLSNTVSKLDPAGNITVIAGTGAGSVSGIGGPATSANIENPSDVAVDAAGNVYFADSAAHQVFRIDAVTQILSSVAGNGTQGYSGDNGPATMASLNYPQGVALDAQGNLYVEDQDNNLIRKIDASGIITTIAGNPATIGQGSTAFNGDGGPATQANLALCCHNETFAAYDAIAVDAAGNLYIGDSGHQVVREVTTDGIIHTVAGNNTLGGGYSGDGGAATNAQLNWPMGVALDPAGDLYIADFSNNRIREVDAATQTITTVAGNGQGGSAGSGGPATQVSLNGPQKVVLDGEGNLIVADTKNNLVRKTDVSNPTLTFVTPTAVGSTDSTDGPLGAVISDIGNAPLTLPPPSTGTNPSTSASFSLSSSENEACPELSSSSAAATLTMGSSCTLAVNFAPVAAGNISGSLVLTDNSLNATSPYATQTITLVGTATPGATPQPVLTPSTMDFGNVPIGTVSAPQTATLQNNGTVAVSVVFFNFSGSNPGGFSESDNCGKSLAAGSSCSIAVTCEPVIVETLTASLNANFASPIPQQSIALTCNGTAAAAPQAALTPATANFGSVTTGTTSSAQTFTLTNAGNAALAITSVSLSGANASSFKVSSNTCGSSLAANKSCTLAVTFLPATAGGFTASLSVVDAVGTQTSALTGTGTTAPTPQAALTPATANFGSVTTGTTGSAQTFTLTNAGNAALSITSIGIAGTNANTFMVNANTCGTSLAAGKSCTIAITFSPTSIGSFSASVSAVDAVGTQISTLTGTGTAAPAPQAALTPATANFGSVTTGTTSSAQTFTLTNAGNASLSITSISLSGTNASSFAIAAKTCGSALAAGASCTISLTFSPAAAGSFTASLSIVDAVGTQTSSLAGSGTTPAAPQAALTPASLNFGSQAVGTAGSSTAFTLTNAGNAALPITSINVTGTNAASFMITGNSCGSALNAGASCTIKVDFDPSSAGNFSATLSVADSLGTQTSSLSGTGIASVPSDFTIAATPSAQSSYRGTSVLYTVNLTSTTADNPFTQMVTLSAIGLSSGASVSFSPAGLVPGTTNPATTTMTVEVPALSASRTGLPGGTMPAGVSLACLGGAWLLRRRRKGIAICVLLVVLACVATASLSGCGSSSTGFAVPTSTSTITITGTSGSTVHSTTVTLTVK